MRNRLVTFTGVGLIVLAVLGTLEIAAYLYTTYLARRYGIIFYLPHIITEGYDSYSDRVHPLLGWPSLQALQKHHDRIISARATDSDSKQSTRKVLISAYGDSFTAGWGVETEDTWSNVLGNLLGCPIENYGVAGYGTDQSYLRFHYNSEDEAKIVLFGHLSENIQRNVNQLRNFISPSKHCKTKPRFVLKEGRLTYVPLPQLTPENYDKFIQNPKRFLSYDYFVPGGLSGAQKLEFPYTWSIVKAYRFFYNRYVLGYKSYLQFYRPDHPSKAFPLTMAIIKQFLREAEDRGQHPILLIFPTDEDFRVYNKNHKFVYKPLIHELKNAHIEYIDLGSEIVKRWDAKNYMDLFSGEKYFHFNKVGNKLIARIIYDYFTNKNYCPRPPRQTFPNRKTPEQKRDIPAGAGPL